MKYALLLVLVCALFLGCASVEKPEYGQDCFSASAFPAENQMQDMVFFSYMDIAALMAGGTERSYYDNCCTALDNIQSVLNATVAVFQVRPFADALYKSSVYPVSRYAVVQNGQLVFDPLQVFIEAASARGVQVWAWINPYRIGASTPQNEEFVVAQASKDKHSVLEYNSLLYLNPASETARELIVSGVREVVENYDVAGVLFDDYFYPTTAAAFDSNSFAEYVSSGGELHLSQYRVQSVSELVSSVYAEIKSVNPKVLFAVSPDAKIARNLTRHCADIELWCTRSGYIDAVIPQIYFGFDNTTMPFESVALSWQELCEGSHVKLYAALAAYKCGKSDAYALDGSSEWTQSFDILSRQYLSLQQNSAYSGVAYFRYGSLFGALSAKSAFVSLELYNLSKILS